MVDVVAHACVCGTHTIHGRDLQWKSVGQAPNSYMIAAARLSAGAGVRREAWRWWDMAGRSEKLATQALGRSGVRRDGEANVTALMTSGSSGVQLETASAGWEGSECRAGSSNAQLETASAGWEGGLGRNEWLRFRRCPDFRGRVLSFCDSLPALREAGSGQLGFCRDGRWMARAWRFRWSRWILANWGFAASGPAAKDGGGRESKKPCSGSRKSEQGLEESRARTTGSRGSGARTTGPRGLEQGRRSRLSQPRGAGPAYRCPA